MEKINIDEKLANFTDLWSPKIIGELNGQCVKLAKVKGKFVWHAHENEDELFYVIKGRLTIEFRDGEVVLNEGEVCIVPKKVEHRPTAEEETHILLFEPQKTAHTGKVRSELTVDAQEYI